MNIQYIGVVANVNNQNAVLTCNKVIQFLIKSGKTVLCESSTLSVVNQFSLDRFELNSPSKELDLVIIIGGDGSILRAAKYLVDHELPIIGINRGKLGFLAELSPNEFEHKLTEIFAGNFFVEPRMLLTIEHDQTSNVVMNDAVLFSGGIARMVSFSITVNGKYMTSMISDGLVVSTPTGSTAYSLSSGGSILYPTLPAIILSPLLPHTLTNRPIVLSDQDEIIITIDENSEVAPMISFDGQRHFSLSQGDSFVIKKYSKSIDIIHPHSYDYFSILRQKLHWNKNVTN